MKALFSLLFSLCFCFFQAQMVTIHGTVRDENQKPIAQAEVKIKDQKYEYLLHTNEEGVFSKKLYAASEKIELSITKYGFQNYGNKNLSLNHQEYNFTLQRKSKEIETITIKKGVTYKGDSTIFNADYYSNKKENKVADLLKKLPGVDIDKKGKVTVNGKTIDKVLVESETFFSGGSSLAINSLPANIVDKFEIIENYKDSQLLSSGKEATILNIKIKDEKKNIIFGDILMNGNSKNRYRVGYNLFYYTPNLKASLINNFNNTNESSFSISDYIQFNGGVERMLKDPISLINQLNTEEILHLLNSSEKFSNTQFFNAGNLHLPIWKSRYKISIFNINNYSNAEEIQKQSIQFSAPTLNLFERTEDIYKNNLQKNNTFSLNLFNTHKNNLDIHYSLFLKNNNSTNEEKKEVYFTNRQDFNNYTLSSHHQTLNQTIDISYRLNEQHTQGITATSVFSENQADRSYHSNTPYFFLPIFNLHSSENTLAQKNINNTNFLKFQFQHQFNFWKKHQAKLNIGFHKQNEKEKNYYSVNQLDKDNLSSLMTLNRSIFSFGGEYQYTTRKLIFSGMLTYFIFNNHFYSNYNTQYTITPYWLPEFRLEYKNNTIGNLTLKYLHTLHRLKMKYFYTGDFIQSVSSLFKGIENPQNPLHENIIFHYVKKSDYDGYNISLQIKNTRYLKDYLSDTKSSSLQSISSVSFRENTGYQQEVNLRLEKQLWRKKLSIITQPILSKEAKTTIINHEEGETRTQHFSIRTAIKSRFKSNYNFELFNSYNHSSFENSINKNQMKMNEFGFELNIYPWDFLHFSTRFSFFYDLINKTKFNESQFLMEYTPNSSLALNFSVRNLLNSQEKIAISNDDLFSYTQKIRLMPRFFYIGLTYKL